MRRLPPSLAPIGYSPTRYVPLSPAPVSDQGQRLTDLMAIQRLFANGENGGYWPADPAYLYEDSAGTIPASVNGVVGVAFDVKYGFRQLGSELVTGFPSVTVQNFNGSVGVWTLETLTMTNTGATESGYPRFRFNNASIVVGKRYLVSGTLSGNINKVSYVRLSILGITDLVGYNASSGYFYGEMVAASGLIEFVTNLAVGESITIKSLSIKEVLGNHAIQATTANKPYLRRTPVSGKFWLDSNTATGALTATFGGSLGSACTIATVGAEGVTIAENQTVGSTYNIAPAFGYNGDVLVINRALTVAEKALVTRVLERGVPMLGDELLKNWDFDVDLTGWSLLSTDANNTITWEAGSAKIVGDGSTSLRLSQLSVWPIGVLVIVKISATITSQPAPKFPSISAAIERSILNGITQLVFITTTNNGPTVSRYAPGQSTNALIHSVSAKAIL